MTLQDTAQRLEVKPRTVHDLVRRGQLHPRKVARPGVSGGPVSMFSPEEVETLREQREAAKQAELVPANDRGPLTGAVARTTSWFPQPPSLSPFLAATVLPIDRKLYLNLVEASIYTGLGKSYLRKQGKGLPIGPRRALVFKRTELDKL